MTRNPWIASKITATRRAARPGTCPHCHAPTITGPDSDTAACLVALEPHTISHAAEIAYRQYGVTTYTLNGRNEIDYRDSISVKFGPGRHPIYAQHQCQGEGDR